MQNIIKLEIENILDKYHNIKTTDNVKYFKELLKELNNYVDYFNFNIHHVDSYYVTYRIKYDHELLIYDKNISIINNFIHKLSNYVNNYQVNINCLFGDIDLIINNYIDNIICDINNEFGINIKYDSDGKTIQLRIPEVENGTVHIPIDYIEPLKYQLCEE